MYTNKIKASSFRVDGENLSLLLTLIISLTIGLAFIKLNLWITIGLVILGFIYIKLQQAQLIGNALEVKESQFSELYEIFKSHKERLGLKNVNLYIRQDPQPDAFTIGFPRASIILSSALVENLSLEEISFVIAHELGHVKASHNIILTFINPLGNGIPGGSLIFSFWQRKAEYSCDRCALILTKTIEPAIMCLLRLSIGLDLGKKINLGIYKEQLVNSSHNAVRISELLFDHPLTTNRINKMIYFWKENFIKR